MADTGAQSPLSSYEAHLLRTEADHLERALAALALEVPGAVHDHFAPMVHIAVMDKRKLADLLDAIGEPTCTVYNTHKMAPCGDCRACRIAAVLEAHRG